MSQKATYRIRLTDVIKGKTPLQMRLKGKLWQWRAPEAEVSATPLVLFALPLISRRRAGNWDVVQENLGRTLDSLRRQSDPHWRALVCGQDAPDVEWDDRIQFLSFKGTDKFYDKGDKRIALIHHLSRQVTADGYYMQLDADDLLHPDLVAHVRRGNNGAGYVLDRGYMADIEAGLWAELRPDRSPFYTVCGSSALVRYDFRTPAARRAYRRLLLDLKAHSRVVQRMAYRGFALEAVPFPAAVYVMNHGENMVQRRGKLDGKLTYLDRFALPEADVAQARTEFGV